MIWLSEAFRDAVIQLAAEFALPSASDPIPSEWQELLDQLDK